MKPNYLVEILLLVVLAVGAVVLIQLRDPAHFWQDAWIPALAIVGIAMRRMWARR